MHSMHAQDTDVCLANPVTPTQPLFDGRVSGGTHSISPAYLQGVTDFFRLLLQLPN